MAHVTDARETAGYGGRAGRAASIALVAGGALAFLGCRAETHSAAVATSTATAPPLPPPWLGEASRLYHAALDDPPPLRAPFGRVQATLAVAAGSASASRCAEPKRGCTLEGHLYVRAARDEDGLRILPQCTVMEPNEVLAPADELGPWQLTSGSLAAGSTAKLRGRLGATLALTVERWTVPGPLPPRARDAWLYTRSLVVAHARTFGIALDVDRWTGECGGGSTPQQRDACRATRGSPLALWLDPSIPGAVNGEPDLRERPPRDWIRERVLAPVHGNDFGGFNGRSSPDEPRTTCAQIEARMRPSVDMLLTNGLDLPRFTVGAILTDGDLYYPQVSLRHLAHVLGCLGFAGRVSPALSEIAALPSLDWQNRFRAVCLSRLLDGKDCDLELLREALRSEGTVTSPGEDPGNTDRQCVEALMGQFVLSG